MARIRSTHPGQWRDQDFVECSFGARLLALALRNEADDSGIFEWKPKQIKMACFPADSVDIDALLSEIVTANIVRQYEIDGRHYGAIRNFRLYQRPKTPNSLHPMTDEIRKYVGLMKQDFGNKRPSPNPISEMDEAEKPPLPPKVEPLPKSTEQVEGVGGRVKEERCSSLRSEDAREARPVSEADLEPPAFMDRRQTKFDPPDWVPRKAWDSFVKFRKKGKAPWTDDVAEYTVDELQKLHDAGHDIEAVLKQSVQRGWTGVFPTKAESYNGSGHSEKRSTTSQHLAGIADAISDIRAGRG